MTPSVSLAIDACPAALTQGDSDDPSGLPKLTEIARKPPLTARAALVALLALMLAFVAVRAAAVKAFADRAPAAAAKLWPSHPRVAIGIAMEDIGRAAARSEAPAASSIDAIAAAARKAPLAEEPFLVLGIKAQLSGNAALAERSFLAARARAPREPATRYFLAQQLLTMGRSDQGLKEIATLARLMPSGMGSLVPTLAAYAGTPGAIPHLRVLFRTEPKLGELVLTRLAQDAANTDLVLALAEAPSAGGPTPAWARLLIHHLADDGQYARSHRLWRSVVGSSSADSAIFDSEFRGSEAPAPFNWTFASGGVGLAEPSGDGALKVLFHGSESGALASQLLLLRPGDYIFSLRVTGGSGRRGPLGWQLTCMPEKNSLLDLPLDRASPDGEVQARFRVPATGCPAQQLQLRGTAPDISRPVDLAINGVTLRRAGQ